MSFLNPALPLSSTCVLCPAQVGLDRMTLPIKQLKGTDPVASLNFSKKRLGDASAIVIASLIRDNPSLTVINLLYNEFNSRPATALAVISKEKGISLCGITSDQISVDFNKLGVDTRYTPTLGAADAILLAADFATMPSLTECNVRGNNLDDHSATVLAKAATEKRIMLFGKLHEQTEASLRHFRLEPPDIILIASDLRASASLTSLDVTHNRLDDDSKQLLREAAAARSGFTLEM